MNIEIWISRILSARTKSRRLCMRVFNRVSCVFVTFKVAQLLGKLSLKDVSDLLRYILFLDLLQNVFQLWISYVNQHISVSAVFHSHRHILVLTTVVMFNSFLLCTSWDNVVIKLTPLPQNRLKYFRDMLHRNNIILTSHIFYQRKKYIKSNMIISHIFVKLYILLNFI